MAADPVSTQRANPSYTPSAAEPKPKDDGLMRIAMIALPVIAVLAAFALLPIGKAIVVAAVVAAGALWYMRSGTSAPAKKEEEPDPVEKAQPETNGAAADASASPAVPTNILVRETSDGGFAFVSFKSAKAAKAFGDEYLDRRFPNCVKRVPIVDAEENIELYFKPGVPAGTRADIAETLRLMAKGLNS